MSHLYFKQVSGLPFYNDFDWLSLKWKLIRIRGFTVKYSKNQAKQRKSMESHFQKQINELYKKAETHPNNKQIINEICCQIPLKKHNAI